MLIDLSGLCRLGSPAWCCQQAHTWAASVKPGFRDAGPPIAHLPAYMLDSPPGGARETTRLEDEAAPLPLPSAPVSTSQSFPPTPPQQLLRKAATGSTLHFFQFPFCRISCTAHSSARDTASPPQSLDLSPRAIL